MIIAPRRPRAALPVVAATAGALLLSGCSLGSVGRLDLRAGSEGSSSSATITVTPSPARTASPSSPVVVTVASGRLTDVSVAGPGGVLVPGTLSPDGRTWTSQQGVLDFGAAYQVRAAAVDRAGLPTDVTATVRTLAVSSFLGFSMTPDAGSQVGVGMPIVLTLDHALTTREARAAFESRLRVTADGAPVQGAWAWQTDDVVEYRPMTYWPGHATITVTAAVKGVRFDRGLWGQKDVTQTFTTGPAMVSYVDIAHDHMTVTRDGKVIRVIPVTTGKVGFETRSGIKVIMTKEYTRIMDAATGGTAKNSKDYYRIQVYYAMRLTWSGEFLHAAPWSVYAQGSQNVSHGCTGMSMANAQWLYNRSEIGDVVVYTGSPRPMDRGNGITVWNMSWARWKAGSALSA